MSDRKIINQLKKLSPKEWSSFGDFLSSPYYNKDLKILALYDFLVEHIQKNGDSELDDHKCYFKIYQSEQFNLNIYNKLHSKIFQLYESFIAIENFEQNDFEKEIRIARYYYDHNDIKSLTQKIEEIEKYLKKITKREANYLKYKYEITRLKYDALIKNDPRKGALNIQELLDTFDEYMMITKLELFIAAETRKSLFNVDFNFNFREEIIHLIDTTKNITPTLKVYATALKLISEPSNKDVYQLLFIYLDSYSMFFNKEDIIVFYNLLESKARRMFSNNREYYLALFDIYNKMIEKEVILFNGEMVPTKYMNLIAVGISLLEFDWSKNIIKNYKKYLPADTGEDYTNYNLARIYFAESKFDLVFNHLIETQYQNIDLKLGVKRLYVKTYFEQKDYLVLENYLNSFKIFIHRQDSISKYHKDLNNDFIVNMHKLLKLVTDPNRKGLEKFSHKLEVENQVIEKQWLLEKIKSMTK